MNTTSGSTAETDRFISYLPADHAALIRNVCNGASQRQAAQERQAALMRERKAKHTQKRREALVAAIHRVIEHREHMLAKMTRTDRAAFVLERLEINPSAYGLPDDWESTTKTIRVIRPVLRAWERKMAVSYQDRAK